MDFDASLLSEPGSIPGLASALIDEIDQGASLWAEDGTLLHANEAEHACLGHAPGELVGRPVWALLALPADEARARVASILTALRRGDAWQGDWPARRRDGSTLVGRVRIRRVTEGGVPIWLCLRQDRLGRVAEDDGQARLALATRAAGLGIWDWSPGTGLVSLSPRAREIFGLEPGEEVTAGRLGALIHPEDFPKVEEQYRRAFDPGMRDRGLREFRILRPDGTLRWVASSGEAVFEDGPEGPRAVRYLGTLQDVTARHALEEAEREAARRLRLALEAGRMAVWEVDVLSDRITGSPGLNRLLGFPEEEPLDTGLVRARYAPGERERLAAVGLAAMARGESSFEAEFRYLRAPDDPRWLRLRCDLLFDGTGRPVRALGVVFDETERRRAEEDLRASEARLQLASRALGAGVWDRDLLTGEVVWSEEEFSLLGVDPATRPEQYPTAWWDAVAPEDADRLAERIGALERDGGLLVEDFRVRLPDGRERWVRMHAKAVPDGDGRTRRVVGIEIDVTAEHERARSLEARNSALADEVEARRREQDRFHALSSDLFSVSDLRGFLLSVNPAWTRLLGYSEEELLARPLLDFIHPDDHAAVIAIVEKLMAEPTLHRFEDRLLAKDGRVLWVEWTGVLADGLFYAVGRDVTREREREEILRQAQKMDALGQLTGGIAHDFNNLLQAVQGSLSLISRKAEDPGRVRMLAEAGLDAARRGSSLTGQLLAFSRHQQIELRPVPVAERLRGLQDLLQRSLGPLVEIRLELPEEALAARADPTQLEMAVLNLAINARDATPRGGAVTIRAEGRHVADDPELSAGAYVVIEVRDNGVGMPPEVAARAFEPFFTTKGVGKGTGLGLSQVYGMARQAGGTARIESRPGAGTSVLVWLPRAEERPAPAASRAEEVPVAPSARPLRVLVVDDDPDVRRWLGEALEVLGHGLLEAADGPAGLEALMQDPDVALVDFAMPGMTGIEVLREIDRRRPGLPAILTTGYADTAELTGSAQEPRRVLRKPFTMEELDAVLRAATAARIAARA